VMLVQFVISNSQPRYEHKYTLEVSNEGDIKPLIAANPLGLRPIFHLRQINNIYFDDKGLNLYKANMIGQASRYKVRLRWYGKIDDPMTKPQLEVKVKQGEIVYKYVIVLSSMPPSVKLTPAFIMDQILGSPIDIVVKEVLMNLRPSFIGSYQRRYYQVAGGGARMTVDTDLAGRRQFFADSFGWPSSSDNDRIILELKYQPEYIDLASKLIQGFPVSLMKHSKYVYGLEVDTP